MHPDLDPAAPDIDALYREIRQRHREGHLDLALACGGTIVQRLWGGSFEPWRTSGARDPLFLELADRAALDGGLSAAELRRLVALMELDDRIGLRGRPHVTVTHAVAVLGLPAEVQRQLLQDTDREAWSTRHLREVLRSYRARTQPTGRGRPAQGAIVKAARRLRMLALPTAADLDRARPEELAHALPEVLAALDRLNALRDELQARLSPAPDPDPPERTPARMEIVVREALQEAAPSPALAPDGWLVSDAAEGEHRFMPPAVRGAGDDS